MQSTQPTITVITLCRDNPQQLEYTLAAIPQAVEGLTVSWQVLVLDGSRDLACAEMAQHVAENLKLPLRVERRQPRGIYVAMNQALALVEDKLVAFMHAGDRYLPGALTALVNHWRDQGSPVAVFGQAWVTPGFCTTIAQDRNHKENFRPWLTPDPSMRSLRRWLRAMVPCHQAFVFERDFAKAHPYAGGSLVADREVMRAALATAGARAYLPRPVCEYDLTGVSSSLPDLSELWQRLQDPQRTVGERAAEIAKTILRLLVADRYPRLMRWRSQLWGWCCR